MRITDGRSAASPSSATGQPALERHGDLGGLRRTRLRRRRPRERVLRRRRPTGPRAARTRRFGPTGSRRRSTSSRSSASGMPHSSASTSAFSRGMFASRMGASTSRSGASTPNDTSNLTWSLPLPVQPWATTSAPTSRATRTTSSTMQRSREPRHHRVLALVQRVRLDRVDEVVRGEPVDGVHDPDVGGARAAGHARRRRRSPPAGRRRRQPHGPRSPAPRATGS